MSFKENITHLEYRKIQMEAIVPYIRFFEKKLGKDVVYKLLGQYANEKIANAKLKNNEPIDFAKNLKELEEFSKENSLEYSVIRQDDEHFDFNITKCSYTNMMKELNAQDIGHLLLCSNDFVKAIEDGLDLKRTKTCMEGHDCCDFKYSKRLSNNECNNYEKTM